MKLLLLLPILILCPASSNGQLLAYLLNSLQELMSPSRGGIGSPLYSDAARLQFVPPYRIEAPDSTPDPLTNSLLQQEKLNLIQRYRLRQLERQRELQKAQSLVEKQVVDVAPSVVEPVQTTNDASVKIAAQIVDTQTPAARPQPKPEPVAEAQPKPQPRPQPRPHPRPQPRLQPRPRPIPRELPKPRPQAVQPVVVQQVEKATEAPITRELIEEVTEIPVESTTRRRLSMSERLARFRALSASPKYRVVAMSRKEKPKEVEEEKEESTSSVVKLNPSSDLIAAASPRSPDTADVVSDSTTNTRRLTRYRPGGRAFLKNIPRKNIQLADALTQFRAMRARRRKLRLART